MMARVQLCLLGLAGFLITPAAQAGVEPSPFKTEINQLSSVDHVLEVAGTHLAEVLVDYRADGGAAGGHPPDPGLVGRIDALSLRVGVADGRVGDVLAELHPPEPGVPVDAELGAALAAVRSESLAIWEQTDGVLHPPDPGSPPPDDDLVALALFDLQVVSEGLVDRIDTWADEPADCSVEGLCSCEDACSAAFAACEDAAGAESTCAGDLEVCASRCILSPSE